MKKIVLGVLAHVDAGKTTLSESLLYSSGKIRKLGRVDNGDAYLDTFALEKARGITIFSKQAKFTYEDLECTLLDTPGHVDFSAEMERALQVLDAAILVVSGADGVQGHTRTLWKLLQRYQVPAMIFVNKMDQSGTNKDALLAELQKELSQECLDFTLEAGTFLPGVEESIAATEESLIEAFLETETLSKESIAKQFMSRKIFPCFFGSALKMEGVEELLQGICAYYREPVHGESFGARVYKIGRDEQGNRLTYVKMTGGSLRVKSMIGEEKVNQLRIYSGSKYDAREEVFAGEVCALTGLEMTKAGEGLGAEAGHTTPILAPVLTYQILLPEGMDALQMLPKLRQLEEEEPELHIVWKEALQEIQAQLMGEVQIEILQSMIQDRFDVDVSFGPGNIVYKETITDLVEGVGHFEPLRHYAEVHLKLEPGEAGSGVVVAADCSEDLLDKNWQRLILTHLEEREFVGVLTGSAITDIKITLVTGRAHQKHTEGGDFRQATYRAVRQGLMQAHSLLLEPYYQFRLEVPENMIGRAMTDLERLHGKFEMQGVEHEMAVLTGTAPVACLQGYQRDVNSYSKGQGKLSCSLNGYDICHNPEAVMEAIGYDPERDLANPSGSVFCAHGAGYVVPWDQVKELMHLESVLKPQSNHTDYLGIRPMNAERGIPQEMSIGTEEIDAILNRTSHANSQAAVGKRKWTYSTKKDEIYIPPVTRNYEPKVKQEEYLLVDGYNIIFAWPDLSELAAVNVDAARGKLLDVMSNYQAMKKCNLIVVFDAYRVKGHQTEITDYHNIHVVYTKEAETADQYIERFAHENGKKYQVTVATSDGLEQIIIVGQGCRLFSAREFKKEVESCEQTIRTEYLEKQIEGKTRLGELHEFFDTI